MSWWEPSVRMYRGTLQAARVRYLSPDEHTVTLFGMVHIGEAEFYDDAAIRVAELERNGAVVLFESTIDDPTMTRTSAEQALLDRMSVARMYTRLADGLGLMTQHAPGSAFERKDTWIRTDMSALDVIRAIPDVVERSEKANASLDEVLDGDPEKRKMLLSMLRWSMRHMPLTAVDSVLLVGLDGVGTRVSKDQPCAASSAK